MSRIRSRPHVLSVSVRSLALAFVFTAGAPTLALSQARGRPLAIEDYYLMKNVGSPALSPDGRWVVFDVTTRVEATNGTDSEVWLVPTDGSTAARRVSAAGV